MYYFIKVTTPSSSPSISLGYCFLGFDEQNNPCSYKKDFASTYTAKNAAMLISEISARYPYLQLEKELK
jgi:hypothetical protein